MPQHFLRRARRSRPECVMYHLPSIRNRSPLSIDILNSSDQAASACSRATPKCFPHLERASRRFRRTKRTFFLLPVFIVYLLDHHQFLFLGRSECKSKVSSSVKEMHICILYATVHYVNVNVQCHKTRD